MTTVTLHRTRTGPEGTFGVLYLNSRPVCVTCEDPWLGNLKGESCIPEGRYRCVPHSGPRFSNVWEVTKVPGRSTILIHAGNSINDTQGCILPGLQFGEVEGLPAVIKSQDAMLRLRAVLPKEFWLQIINGRPE